MTNNRFWGTSAKPVDEWAAKWSVGGTLSPHTLFRFGMFGHQRMIANRLYMIVRPCWAPWGERHHRITITETSRNAWVVSLLFAFLGSLLKVLQDMRHSGRTTGQLGHRKQFKTP